MAIVAALCIDVARSTSTGLEMRQNQRFEFQKAAIDVMMKYWPSLELYEREAKFTGDGWLIFSPDQRDWLALVILAKTLCAQYQTEVANLMTLRPNEIPGVRACICTGYDMEVEFPRADGTMARDWIGDSARRASRFSNCPGEGELYVDQAIRDLVYLQFAMEEIDFSELEDERKPKREEERRSLWIVGDVHANTVSDARDPKPYMLLLNWTGHTEQSGEIASQINENETRTGSFADDTPESEEQQRIAIQRLLSTLGGTPADGPRTSLIKSLADRGVKPDIYYFNKRINVAPDYPDAVRWYEEMTNAGVTPNAVTFNTLINAAPDYPDAVRWYEEMTNAGVTPDAVTFSTLIKVAPDYPDAVRWYEEMTNAGVTPNAVTFNTLINAAPDYPDAVRWYEEMTNAGVTPNAVTFNTLIKVAPDYPDAVRWYKEMTNAGVTPNAVTFNTLINAAPDYPDAVRWYKEMTNAGVTPDAVTFSTLINAAPDYPDAVRWYEEMTNAGVTPNAVTFSTLINAAPDYPDAVRWYEEMTNAGVTPNAVTFSTLIKVAPDYPDAVRWYEEMTNAGVTPDAVTFNTLINAAPDYPDAVRWYEEMTNAGVTPNAVTFNTLINAAPDYPDAVRWYEEMTNAGVTPDAVITTTLANRAPTFSTAQALTVQLRAHKAFRGQGYYSAVFAKVPDDADPIDVINWYFQQDYRHVLSLEPVIGIFSRANREDAAMEFVVRWPQLPSAKKFMRDKPDKFRREIARFIDDPETKPSALYALGIFHVEQNETAQACAALTEALAFPTADVRRHHINSMLKKLDEA